MPRYKNAAVARHAYLLARFKAHPLPNSARVEFRFEGNLPRAKSIQEAISAAMVEEGVPVPGNDGVEVTEQHAKQIKYLLSLFTKAAPETVVASDDPKFTDVLYSYGFTLTFSARPTATFQEVLDGVCQYEPPSAIGGLRKDPEQLYELLHIALRKCADSKETSAAWNAMHVIDGPTRQWLVDVTAAALSAAEYTNAEQVIAAVKKALLADEHKGTTRPITLMTCLFEMFDDNDWYGFLGYCIIWPYEVKVEAPVGASSGVEGAPSL